MSNSTNAVNVGGISQPLLTPSDASAALMSVVFKYAMPSYGGTYGKNALRSLLISIVARMVPGWTTGYVNVLTDAQKNQIVVAVLGGVSASVMRQNPLQGAVGQVSIDLLGQELVNLLGINDGVSVWNSLNKAP